MPGGTLAEVLQWGLPAPGTQPYCGAAVHLPGCPSASPGAGSGWKDLSAPQLFRLYTVRTATKEITGSSLQVGSLDADHRLGMVALEQEVIYPSKVG